MIWPGMPRTLPHLASIAPVSMVAATAAPAQTAVNFTSLDGTTNLVAYLVCWKFMKRHLESN
jgi:hypothetical protein